METKKYTRLDTVEATPMTFGEFEDNWCTDECIGAFSSDTKGYLVHREERPEEWIPKEDFEKQFVETDDYIGRMKFEMLELGDRIDRLRHYVDTHAENELLMMQSQAMNLYLHFLSERIRQAGGK